MDKIDFLNKMDCSKELLNQPFSLNENEKKISLDLAETILKTIQNN